MSLNAGQRRATSTELRANLALAELSVADLAGQLGQSAQAVEQALEVAHTDPVLVWAVRDELETAVRANGRTPVPFTVLTEAARAAAQGWFGIN